MMKSVARVLVMLSLLVLPFGSFGSFVCGHLDNIEGDGIEPAQTFTATVLGLDRGNRCDREGSGWSCFHGYFQEAEITMRGGGFYWDVERKLATECPIAAWVARWMLMPFEWLLAFVSFAAYLLLVKKWWPEKKQGR